MGLPQAPNPPHPYPQELQLKLYQAFIFSIPILFSIILFLLFYLFYLKRRASSLSPPPQILPRSSNQSTSYISSICRIGLKEELKEKLPIVLFDEELRTKESQCCVCLGEFEIKEELLQIPSCKHVFHIDCIHHWLHSNASCPLCRCFVIFPTTKLCTNPPQASGPVPLLQDNASSHQPSQNITPEHQQQTALGSASREQVVIHIEGSSSDTTHSNLPMLSISMENGQGSSTQESVTNIQTHSA